MRADPDNVERGDADPVRGALPRADRRPGHQHRRGRGLPRERRGRGPEPVTDAGERRPGAVRVHRATRAGASWPRRSCAKRRRRFRGPQRRHAPEGRQPAARCASSAEAGIDASWAALQVGRRVPRPAVRLRHHRLRRGSPGLPGVPRRRRVAPLGLRGPGRGRRARTRSGWPSSGGCSPAARADRRVRPARPPRRDGSRAGRRRHATGLSGLPSGGHDRALPAPTRPRGRPLDVRGARRDPAAHRQGRAPVEPARDLPRGRRLRPGRHHLVAQGPRLPTAELVALHLGLPVEDRPAPGRCPRAGGPRRDPAPRPATRSGRSWWATIRTSASWPPCSREPRTCRCARARCCASTSTVRSAAGGGDAPLAAAARPALNQDLGPTPGTAARSGRAARRLRPSASKRSRPRSVTSTRSVRPCTRGPRRRGRRPAPTSSRARPADATVTPSIARPSGAAPGRGSAGGRACSRWWPPRSGGARGRA